MSLIYTEGYLESKPVTFTQQDLPSNIKNILIVPPQDNNINIKVSIYKYSPNNPVYEIYLLKNAVFLKDFLLEENVQYYIKTSNQTVQLYYEKEDINV